jgi:hypothetical protein
MVAIHRDALLSIADALCEHDEVNGQRIVELVRRTAVSAA